MEISGSLFQNLNADDNEEDEYWIPLRLVNDSEIIAAAVGIVADLNISKSFLSYMSDLFQRLGQLS